MSKLSEHDINLKGQKELNYKKSATYQNRMKDLRMIKSGDMLTKKDFNERRKKRIDAERKQQEAIKNIEEDS